MSRKDLKRQKKLLKTKQSLKQFYDLNRSLIEKSIYYGKVEIREYLRAVEGLFFPFPQKNMEKRRLFEMPMTSNLFGIMKKWADSTRYLRVRKEVMKAVKETQKIQKRQYFRNMEAFRLMYNELHSYKKAINKLGKHLNVIMKYEKNVKEMVSKFLENRKRVINLLFSEINKLEKVSKKEFINDINIHINAFIDFFFQELERLNSLNLRITKIIVADDEELTSRCKCMIEEPSTCFKLPGLKMLLEV